MICTEVDGVKRILFKIILPAVVMVAWANMCYWICRTDSGMAWFQFWVLCGFPYGIRKMTAVLVPKNFGIGGSMGVFAFDTIIGGLIGCGVMFYRLAAIVREVVQMVVGHFWSQCPEAGKRPEEGL